MNIMDLREEANRLGFALVPKMGSMTMKEFSDAIGIPIPTIRDHIRDYDHLRLFAPTRRLRFNKQKVFDAIDRGRLTRQA